jgi:adenylylsulfate kinase
MNKEQKHIHPIFDKTLQREDKELLLSQKSKVLWFTGLSGSGKSTLAIALEQKLYEYHFFTKLLDGDNIRVGINNNLGFSDKDRQENIRRIAEISKLFLQDGIITINSFVSPTKDIRELAKNVIGENDFNEIYVKASLEICEKRDVKGLYAKARKGEIKDFTGISAPFEEPLNPNITINTGELTIEESIEQIWKYIYPIIKRI